MSNPRPTSPVAFSARWLSPLLAVAIGLRIVAALIHPLTLPDSLDYGALAIAIVHGAPYEVNGLFATRMPGYPCFMAAVSAIFGPSDRAVLVIQALMGGGIVFMTYLLARRAGEGIGLLAAALASVDPLSIGFSAALLSETPFTLLLLLSLWLCLYLSDGGRWHVWVVLGIVWAAAVYLRAEALLCIIPLGLFAWLQNRRAPREGGSAAFSVFGLLLCIAIAFVLLLPWQIRNYELLDSGFFRLTTLQGISLYEAVYPGADGGPKQDVIALPPEMRRLNEAQRNDEWSRRAWHDVFSEPGRITELAVRKIARTWSITLNAREFQDHRVQVILALWHIPLFVFAIFGLFGSGLPSKIKGFMLLAAAYFTLVHALFLGSVRYRVPLMPLVCIFASAGIAAVLRRMRRAKPLPSSTV